MNVSASDILKTLRQNIKLIVWPMMIFISIATAYSIVRTRYWGARQALFVRDESIGALARGGRFESTDAMQTAQETIMEIARHPAVLKSALEDVGKYGGPTWMDSVREKWLGMENTWPGPRTVEDFAKQVNVDAPQGAQFGRTEMIYVSVKGRDVENAVDLTDAVVEHMMARLKRLRAEKYQSIVDELTKSVELGQTQLAEASERLQKMEVAAGADLAELRVLMDQGQGDGNVRRAMNDLQKDVRLAQADYLAKKNLLVELLKVYKSPKKLIAMQNQSLDTHPTLKRLREGLADAQLNTSRLLGIKNQDHPDVQAAIAAEQRMEQQLHRELLTSIRSTTSQVKAAETRVDALKSQLAGTDSRMVDLAAMRTQYSNLAEEVRQRSKQIEQAKADLSKARANQITATSVSLIQKVDSPIPSTTPLGIGNKVLVLGSLAAGLMTGLGLIFVFCPIESENREEQNEGQRRSFGRRASDYITAFGRRASDRVNPGASQGYWDRRSTDRGEVGGNRRASDQREPATPRPAPPTFEIKVNPENTTNLN